MRRMGSAVIAVFLLASVAAADTVTLRGTSIPLTGCEIQDMRHGRLYFKDGRGRRQWRELDDVAALGFSDLPALDEAEALLAAGDSDGGLGKLFEALLETEGDLPRLWVRQRLAGVHDSRGEYVQAVGHAAAVFMLRDESYWRRLEPVSKVDRPGFPAVWEAVVRLQRAKRTVKNRDLAALVDRFIETIQPIHDELAASYDGPPLSEGATISGFPIEEIRSGRLRLPAAQAPAEPADAAPGDEGRREEPAPPAPPTELPEAPAGESAEAIDALLEAGRFAEALDLCRRLAERPGHRSLGRFLHQYGRCLRAEGREPDAAVMFMRCALLYGSSMQAAPSLIETALIYRDFYQKRATARRLLERAREIAAAQGDSETVQRARDILSTVDGDH
jgi:tetratricopeptide (TPR) repeat protein